MQPAFLVILLAATACAQSRETAFSVGKALGNPKAPIRIELFSDYQCPACKVFHEQTVSPLIRAYVNTGKVYLVHREFPLTQVHPHALAAARLACAAEQVGRYQEVCDQLFHAQDAWTKSGDVLGAASSVLSPAEARKLRELAAAPQAAKAVEEDLRLGRDEKVTGTPAMIITKVLSRYPITGPVTYSVLSRFLDSLLN
jgi:protein-disulfide isomerase